MSLMHRPMLAEHKLLQFDSNPRSVMSKKGLLLH